MNATFQLEKVISINETIYLYLNDIAVIYILIIYIVFLVLLTIVHEVVKCVVKCIFILPHVHPLPFSARASLDSSLKWICGVKAHMHEFAFKFVIEGCCVSTIRVRF